MVKPIGVLTCPIVEVKTTKMLQQIITDEVNSMEHQEVDEQWVVLERSKN